MKIAQLIVNVVSRKLFFKFWFQMYRISLAGMGYMNADSRTNGEDRILRKWRNSFPAEQRKIVFDVGANKGDFSSELISIDRNSTLHCFEPHPYSFEILEQRFHENTNVRTNMLAVASSSGQLSLFNHADTKESDHATLSKEAYYSVYHREPIEINVPVVTLDSYCKEDKIEKIDFLKIDVEGLEYEILEGAKNLIESNAIECIQFEFNAHNAVSGNTIWKFSKLLPKFKLYRILQDGVVPLAGKGINYDSRCEVFRYHNLLCLHEDSKIDLS